MFKRTVKWIWLGLKTEVLHYTRGGLYSQAIFIVVTWALWKCILIYVGYAIAAMGLAAVVMTFTLLSVRD